MRICIEARDLRVDDEIAGQGKVRSVVSDADETVVTTQVCRYTLWSGDHVWVDRGGM